MRVACGIIVVILAAVLIVRMVRRRKCRRADGSPMDLARMLTDMGCDVKLVDISKGKSKS